jgi:hypothetical protein
LQEPSERPSFERVVSLLKALQMEMQWHQLRKPELEEPEEDLSGDEAAAVPAAAPALSTLPALSQKHLTPVRSRVAMMSLSRQPLPTLASPETVPFQDCGPQRPLPRHFCAAVKGATGAAWLRLDMASGRVSTRESWGFG